MRSSTPPAGARSAGAGAATAAVGAAIPAAIGSASAAAPTARIRPRHPVFVFFGAAALPKRMNSALFLLSWRGSHPGGDRTSVAYETRGPAGPDPDHRPCGAHYNDLVTLALAGRYSTPDSFARRRDRLPTGERCDRAETISRSPVDVVAWFRFVSVIHRCGHAPAEFAVTGGRIRGFHCDESRITPNSGTAEKDGPPGTVGGAGRSGNGGVSRYSPRGRAAFASPLRSS